MAASAVVFCSISNLFTLLLLCIAVTTNENTTSYDFNTTEFDDLGFTYNVTDNYTTIQPTESDSVTLTGTPSYSSTEQPVRPTLPTEPLPVSGRLPTPVTNVYSSCPCDEQKTECDMNCCCDRGCVEEAALFTSCSVDTVSSGNRQLCSRDVASYSLRITIDGYSELQSSVQKESNYDVLCIQSHNRVDVFSHPPPALPTDSNFDSLFQRFSSFVFGSEESGDQVPTAETQALSGYRYGDVMVTVDESGQRGTFWLPAPSVTADCMDTSPAAFLRDQSSRCTRRVVLEQDCSSLPALSMDTYTNIQLFAGKTKDAAVVNVEVASVVLQSVDGSQTEVQTTGENLSPVLLNPSLCANVVLKVLYLMKYNPDGDIVNVTVSLVLGFVREAALPLEQEFRVTFIQEDGEEVALHYSGNPGYVVGLPLVSGMRTTDGIARSIDPRDTLSLLHSAEEQDCLKGPHQRTPILFGLDSVSGCTLRLEDAANCSHVFQVLLDVLRGPNYPQYVASFGNSPLDHPLDWVPIKDNYSPQETQSCSIPLSRHLEVEWTKYGSLVNPQAQIVSIKEVIQTNTTSLALLSGGSSILSIRSSVAFIPVSAAALPGYRAMPTINAKLPFDFFFPFV